MPASTGASKHGIPRRSMEALTSGEPTRPTFMRHGFSGGIFAPPSRYGPIWRPIFSFGAYTAYRAPRRRSLYETTHLFPRYRPMPFRAIPICSTHLHSSFVVPVRPAPLPQSISVSVSISITMSAQAP
jgi:hypothetical protein